jgi:chlorobactene glucosyltransferase
MLLPLLLVTPWLALLAFLVLRVRLPSALPAGPPVGTPKVSVIVPARDEAVNIEACVRSLVRSTYRDFEVIVVDDRSDDDTAARARSVDAGSASGLTIVHGDELPEGWMGKPWACWQGARTARGDLLLFTDADTLHTPELLERAVAAMEAGRADVVTVVGRQLMETFWERLVQPQVFMTMLLRYFDVERWIGQGRWRDAIANGQFILFRRDAYEALGGHEAVRDEVVEDLALAQRVVRSGRRLGLHSGEAELATRMYRSLAELVAGWSKNILIGGLRTMPPAVRPFVAPTSALVGATLWLLPPVVLFVVAPLGVGGGGLFTWAACTVLVSAVFWAVFTARMGAPFAYGLLYPLGAAVGMYIFLRAWRRGRRVEWKGRTYVVEGPNREG